MKPVARPLYYQLIGQTAVPCEMKEWVAQFEGDVHLRRVALTRIGPFEVSTVFLGLDYSWTGRGAPLLFETMTFTAGDGEFDGNEYDGRTSTWSEAEARHQKAVDFLRLMHSTPDEKSHAES